MKTIKYKFKCNKCEPINKGSSSNVVISKPTGSNDSVVKLENEVNDLKEKLSSIEGNMVEVRNFAGNTTFFVLTKPD